MFSLVYSSKTSQYITSDIISAMLKKARFFNQKNDITGCLLHHHQDFVQLIEGDEKLVKALYKKIVSDNRHQNIVLLNTEETNSRMFGKWHMLYDHLDNTSAQVEKRNLFDTIFHSSRALVNPGVSKLSLWVEVNRVLGENQLHFAN